MMKAANTILFAYFEMVSIKIKYIPELLIKIEK
jgi:hypothetical protein